MPPLKKSKAPTPASEDLPFKLIHGNCLDVLPTLPAMSIDSVVTDPPYELGFMGKSWDNSGIAYDVEMWRYVLRALKPGGHLLAFSGTRTYHRMVCAIEDAGFEIRDQLAYCFGSGFPKSHNVSKGIDKMYGHEREKKVFERKPGMAKSWDTGGGRGFSGTEAVVDTPISEEAETWDGFGSALKPGWEPICLAMRPLIGPIQRNIREYGTGALNIEACRIGASGSPQKLPSDEKCKTVSVGGYLNSRVGVQIPKGRWPANLLLSDDKEVQDLFPKTGASRKGVLKRGAGSEDGPSYGDPEGEYGFDEPAGLSAARFFYCAKASALDRDEGLEDRDEGLEDLIKLRSGGMQATLDGSMLTGNGNDRTTIRANTHTTVKPTNLMQWLVRLITPPNGTVLDPFTGSGSTGKACGLEGFKFIGIEMTDEYIEIARKRILFGYNNFNKA